SAVAKELFGDVPVLVVVVAVKALEVPVVPEVPVVVPNGLVLLEVEPKGTAPVVLVVVLVPVSAESMFPTGTLREVGIPIPLSGFKTSKGTSRVVPLRST